MIERVYVSLNQKIWFLFLSFLISACTFLPAISDTQEYSADCEMLTRELTLSKEFIDFHRGCGTNAEAAACFLAVAIGVPAASFIVSGSVVLAGNTIHWLEYQGTCEGGYLSQVI